VTVAAAAAAVVAWKMSNPCCRAISEIVIDCIDYTFRTDDHDWNPKQQQQQQQQQQKKKKKKKKH